MSILQEGSCSSTGQRRDIDGKIGIAEDTGPLDGWMGCLAAETSYDNGVVSVLPENLLIYSFMGGDLPSYQTMRRPSGTPSAERRTGSSL